MISRRWLVVAAVSGTAVAVLGGIVTGASSGSAGFHPSLGVAGPDGVRAIAAAGTSGEAVSLFMPFVPQDVPGWWQPAADTDWQWQLTGLPVETSFDVHMYDIDMFDNTAGTVAGLQAGGHRVVCYVSAGSWEDWRPDADAFPEVLLGKKLAGWPGERWLDIRRIDLLGPIMQARLDQCAAKGFDGIEPDNVDGYTNDTGFPLTYADQLAYNTWLAAAAHARGLSVGLKNDPDQAGDLQEVFDWAMTEECFAEGWCGQMDVFIQAGKAVFAAEYTDEMTVNHFLTQVCPQATENHFSAILKNRDLDAWRQACP